MGIDLMSMSSHKIYGPKGSGALYIRKGVRISNYLHGGGQESKKRAGTENLTGIVGFGKAAELARVNFAEHVKHCSELRDYLKDRILNEIPDTYVNGTLEYLFVPLSFLIAAVTLSNVKPSSIASLTTAGLT